MEENYILHFSVKTALVKNQFEDRVLETHFKTEYFVV